MTLNQRRSIHQGRLTSTKEAIKARSAAPKNVQTPGGSQDGRRNSAPTPWVERRAIRTIPSSRPCQAEGLCKNNFGFCWRPLDSLAGRGQFILACAEAQHRGKSLDNPSSVDQPDENSRAIRASLPRPLRTNGLFRRALKANGQPGTPAEHRPLIEELPASFHRLRTMRGQARASLHVSTNRMNALVSL